MTSPAPTESDTSLSPEEVVALSRKALADQIKIVLEQLWTEGLSALETALPECKTPGSADFRLFRQLRRGILNRGNAMVRDDIPRILACFKVVQTHTRETVSHTSVDDLRQKTSQET